MKPPSFLMILLAAASALPLQAQENETPSKPKTLVFPPAPEVPEKGKPAGGVSKGSAPAGTPSKGSTPAATPSPAAAPAAPPPSALPATPTVSKVIDPTAGTAPDKLATNFFSLLQRGELDRAYEVLTKGSKISERSEELKALKTKTKEAIDVFGPVLGFELVEAKPIGERLLRKTYVSLGRDFPLRWRLYFYNPDISWRLIDLRVDDRLSGMFDEPDEQRSSAEPRS